MSTPHPGPDNASQDRAPQDSAPHPSAADADRRWPRSVYGVGVEPDARFSFANERTFLAWIRTGLGFLTAGVAIAALKDLNPTLTWEAIAAALVLITCGVATGLAAFFRWMKAERSIRRGTPLGGSAMMPVLSVTIVVVAVIAVLLIR